MYDFAVIGAGLVGSAAAKYLAKYRDGKQTVVVIGPVESARDAASFTKDASHSFNGAYGCHLDAARIVRISDKDPTYAKLNKESTEGFAQLEKESGIRLFYEVGWLAIGPKGGSSLQQLEHASRASNRPVTRLECDEITKKWNFLKCFRTMEAVFDSKLAGHIDPRAVIKAQLLVAKRYGCHLVTSPVLRWRQEAGSYVIMTRDGLVVMAKKVLLAAGAYSKFLLEENEGVRPKCKLLTQVVSLIPTSEAGAHKLRTMPVMSEYEKLPQGQVDKRGHSEKLLHYFLPPVTYPDGKTYIKVGHGDNYEQEIKSRAAANQWYRSIPPRGPVIEMAQGLGRLVDADLDTSNVIGDTCITCHTTTSLPFIDLLPSGLGVAFPGNGVGAKSSDAVGKLASNMMLTGNWNSSLPRSLFRFLGEGSGMSKL